jgi:lipopolysaccharide export system permease protein
MFGILFFVASMTFLIKIASITSVVDVNFLEILELFSFMMPKIIIYIVPVTFFVAMSLALKKLSEEKELIIFFTLGFDPKKILLFFYKIAAIVSVILVIDVLVLIPISKQLYNNFIDYKKTEAKINIASLEFGQKFDDWFVFISSKETKSYKDIVLYSPSEQKLEGENFIFAKDADIVNQNGLVDLSLKEGKAFAIQPSSIRQINFTELSIKDHLLSSIEERMGIVEYWSQMVSNVKIARDFSIFLLLALFPVLSLIFAFAISIYHARYTQASVYIYQFGIIGLFYLFTFSLTPKLPFGSIFIVGALYLLSSYLLYQRNVAKRF